MKPSSRDVVVLKTSSGDNSVISDMDAVKSPPVDTKSPDINEEATNNTDSVSKFTVTPVYLSETDVSVDLNDRNEVSF